MILTVHLFPPTEDQPFWAAGVQELDGCWALAETETLARRDIQVSALYRIADEIQSGTRPTLDLFDSIVFLVETGAY